MSIRFRLLILVAIMTTVSLTTLGYLAAAFLNTRESLLEADAALVEFRCAIDAGAQVGRVRLSLFHFIASPGEQERGDLNRHIDECVRSFERWTARSQQSIDAGIASERDDLAVIQRLRTQMLEQIVRIQNLTKPGATSSNLDASLEDPDAYLPLLENLVEGGIRTVTEDDILELSNALDRVLLSMGTTPWIARIGPAQLATARATLSELQSAHEVRSQLLQLSSDLAAFIAGGDPDEDRALGNATAALEVALAHWASATEAYHKISATEPPPYFDHFSSHIPAFFGQILSAQALAKAGKLREAQVMASGDINQTLENKLLTEVDTSLNVETTELREMLGHLSTSTGLAGAGGIVLVCAVLFSTLLLFLTTARGMIRSIERLRSGTDIIGQGDFNHRVNLESNDELGRLASNFDAMAEKLQEQAARQKALEIELLRNERLATLGKVIATVSHEIRNPLGTIQTSIYALRMRLGNQSEATQRSLDRAERSILRCDRIIGELLDYTRTREPVMTETALDAWLADVVSDFNFPADVTVDWRPGSQVTLPFDRSRMQGCVVNLLANACQSMMESTDRSGPCSLVIESRQDGERVEIRITDSGPGIAPEVLSKVFEPMFSTRTFGVGLGLSIVRKYMEQHGGNVEISSVVGCGTTATLWLPAPKRDT